MKRRPGGSVIRMQCPGCGELAKFHECESKESYSVFFVPFTSDTETVYRCGECGDTFDLVDDSDDGDSDVVEEERQISAEERRRQKLFADLSAKRQRDHDRERAVHSTKTDRELAELKKKLGH